jgi:hypothetical protein
MKKGVLSGLVVGFCMMGLAVTGGATQIPTSLGTSYGNYYGDSSWPPYGLAPVCDGVTPGEGTYWQGTAEVPTVWWRMEADSVNKIYGVAYISLAYDQLYNIQDITLSVDNNDAYKVTWTDTVTNPVWRDLFVIETNYGEINDGMDTMSTVSGDDEYVSGIDFAPVAARYLRITAIGGDDMYSIGEFTAFGSPITAAVPEPATMLLFGLGLLGVAGFKRRMK